MTRIQEASITANQEQLNNILGKTCSTAYSSPPYTSDEPKPTLHLNLINKQFLDVAYGRQKEIYLNITPFWFNFFLEGKIKIRNKFYEPTDVTICLSKCFSKDRTNMFIKCQGISVGEGNPDWGAEPGKQYYIIRLFN